ncbi:MAG: SMP-30/gluconolactonase/LRE family protein [Desulforhopalus sp.]
MTFTIDTHDSRMGEIFDAKVELEKVAGGFRFLEGPVWHPVDKTLIFSDIMGNGLFCKGQDDKISLFRENSYLANGNTYDQEGRLLTCEHGTSRVTRLEKDGNVSVLASHYQGMELNSPNDIVVKSDGSIYFTDPNPGRMPRVGIPRAQELPFQGVFRIDPQGELTLLVDDFSKPNGLCFSNDEKHLFVNDTDHQHIRCFEVRDDGTLGSGRLWTDLYGNEQGVADGMKFDIRGNLYCSGPGGIQVFDDNATLIGRLMTPEVAANFTWGDADLCSLYMAATTSLYRLRVKVPGKALF